MFTRRSFLASFASTVALLTGWRPGWAQATHAANVTFVLFNDFYLMAEQPFPDGKSRGGFARLAAVVKAERERARAEGRTVIVAHGGDTLSPSVMSGLDRGAHIVALTNMIAPDIFVPGNHEFDFGKAVFLERMNEATFPLYGANFRDAGRRRAAALQGPFDRHRRRRAHRAHRARLRAIAAHVLAGRPALCLDASTPRRRRRRRCGQEGADFVCAVLHCNRGDAIKLQYRAPRRPAADRTHARPVRQSRRPLRAGRVRLRRALRDLRRRGDLGAGGRREAHHQLVAAVPRDRYRDGDARSGGRGRGRALRSAADRQDGRSDLHHDGRARFLAPRRCARAKPRSATCSPTRCARRCAPTPPC